MTGVTAGQADEVEVTHDPEIPVRMVQLWLCDLCLDGAGGECHTPGCSLWINRAPDLSLRNNPMVTILAAQQDDADDEFMADAASLDTDFSDLSEDGA